MLSLVIAAGIVLNFKVMSILFVCDNFVKFYASCVTYLVINCMIDQMFNYL